MLNPEQKLAHFKILRQLGEGGMGQVFLAEDEKLTRKVALKIVSEGVFEDAERQERFYREARTAARISHPNVMAIYDLGSAESENGKTINYIVMEYVDGRPLNEYIREQKPDMAGLIRLAEKIGAGLAAAHQMSVVHRDIKSDNIMIDGRGDPKILDFGLAKPVTPLQLDQQSDRTDTISQELTRAGKILGTVKYMSPEQVQGRPVDNRSDIFSFGILLYSMFTGEQPFGGQTQVSTMAKILETPHESPRLKNQDIPPELERIIDKCLQKNPEDRYQDTRDLVVDLRNLRRQHDSGITGAISAVTDKPSGSHVVLKPSASNKKVMMVVGGLVVIVAGILLLSGVFDRTGSSATQLNPNLLAIASFVNKTGNTDYDWMSTGLPEIMLTDLSQSERVQLISQQRLFDRLPAKSRGHETYEECVEAAKQLGAGRILSGTLFKLGDRIRIDARLEDLESGRIILGEKVIGNDPFVLVDSLTTKIAASLNLGKVRSMTTAALSTPEAFKQYHLGMERLWAGEFDKAVDKFKEALAIDSTFALPYMRMGMARVFQNRQAEGLEYLRRAKEYEDKLPIKERGMLDVYADFWLERNFDHGFARAEDMLRNYPEDGEIRTIYALLVNVFRHDTTVVFAQLDTVLLAYPHFPFALEQYAQILSALGMFDRAIDLVEQLVDVLPEVPMPRNHLARMYLRQGRREDARRMFEQLSKDFPDDVSPIYSLISLAIYDRDFTRARSLAEKLKEKKGDDPFTMVDYHNSLANLHIWQGDFKKATDERFLRLASALESNDSQQVYFAYNLIATYYSRFDMDDSAIYYAAKGNQYATVFNKVNYAYTLVHADTANEATARPLFKKAITEFRARLPRDFWPVADGLERLFDAMCKRDTADMIDANRLLISAQKQTESGNVFELGCLLAAHGDYAEAKEYLARFLSGKHESTSGWVYPITTYWMGRSEEGLGNTSQAVTYYRDFLNQWAHPEIQLKEIKDARTRLARLTG